MKRLLDMTIALAAAIVLLVPALLVAIAVKITSPGPALFWSQRVGRHNRLFAMPKFRTMRMGTPAVATHLLAGAQNHLTPIGGFLRRSSLDEIPQIYCILRGQMSLVGPRPALFNQDDLIALRTQAGVDALTPGLTGLAQINGRDLLSIEDKVALDIRYLHERSMLLDLRILWNTLGRVVRRDGIAH